MKIVEKPNLLCVGYPLYKKVNNEQTIAVLNEMGKFALNIKSAQINIWCTGTSGLLIATEISRILHQNSKPCRISFIRTAASHETLRLNYNVGEYNLFVDDFISSGKTIKEAYEKMSKIEGFKGIDSLLVSDFVVYSKLDSIVINNTKQLVCKKILMQ